MERSEKKRHEIAILAHVVPFFAWLFLMQMLGDPAGWKYALRSVVCLGLFLAFRPWKWYGRLNLKNIIPALLIGIGVFIIWVLPESPWFAAKCEVLHDFYTKYGVRPWGKPIEIEDPSPYAPETMGWVYTLIRLAGSAFIIAIIEEFFWRGFVYRWAIKSRFYELDAGTLRWSMFLLVCLAFGLEHNRWLVGILAGMAYGYYYIRCRDLWAVGIAHVTTNLLLGIYVLKTGYYAFW